MKKVRLLLVAAMLVAVLAVGSTAAYAFPAGTWVSGVAVINQSGTTANVSITFYDTAGTDVFTITDTIAGNSQKSWYTPSIPGLPSNFVGSAVVSSDQPVAATVNTQVPTSGTGTMANPNRVGTSNGVNNASPTAYATQVMKGYSGWSSYCSVQNTGGAATTVTATYYDAAGNPVDTDTANIPVNASAVFDQETNGALTAPFSGSATFDGGGQNIAVVCNFYNSGSSYTTAQFHSYNGLSAGAGRLFIPRLVKDYYNYQSGYRIQNVGGSPTTVTVTYFFNGATYTQTSPSIGPGQSWGPYLGDAAQVPELAGVVGSGSAVIESSGQPIIATANEDNRTQGFGVTYNAIPDGEQTNAVLFPQITAKYYGFSGGVQVQNVGGSAATVTAVFSMQGRTDVTVSANVPSMGSVSWFAPNVVGPDFNGSVVVSAGQPLVGIGNGSYRSDVDGRYGVKYGDSFTTYNGINK